MQVQSGKNIAGNNLVCFKYLDNKQYFEKLVVEEVKSGDLQYLQDKLFILGLCT